MAATSRFSWDVSVPVLLSSGTVLTKWEEESNSIQDLNFRVDEYGFYLTWRDEDKVGNCLDLCHVSEIRPGGVPKGFFSFGATSSATRREETAARSSTARRHRNRKGKQSRKPLEPRDSKMREALQNHGPEALEERSFTIVYGLNLVDLLYLHLCASTINLAYEWLRGLQPLLHNLKLSNCSPITQLQKLYIKIGHLSGASKRFSVKSICKSLNAGKYEQRVLDGLQALELPCGKNDELDPNSFTFEHFYQLYLKVCPRLEIDQLRVEWGGGRAPYLNVRQMVEFLNKEQRDPRLNEILFPYYDKHSGLALIWKYETSQDNLKRDRITVKGLTQYLLSEDNLLVMPSQLHLNQDMNQPLSHYFINSSHNTYLVGRQFGGKSSVDMYRQCLLAGCRCIELDCWDGPGDEPIITHGKAMCTNILFKDVIEAIRDTAFVTSEYPVILSFENHCSKHQQYKMACYCTDIFGDILLTKPLEGYPLEEGKSMPSPNALRGRIIIKNKKLKPDQETESDFDRSEIMSDFESSDTSDFYLGLRRYSAITLSSVGSRMSQKAPSMRETAIVDDVDNVVDEVDDVGDDVVDDVIGDEMPDGQKPPCSEKSECDLTGQSVTTSNSKDNMDCGNYESGKTVVNDCVPVAETTASDPVNDLIPDDIRQFKSASEYSAHLLSKILDDAGLNGLKKDMEKELFSDIARTKQLNMTEDEKSSDVYEASSSEGAPPLKSKLSNGLSSSSSSSIGSDTLSDVSEDVSTQVVSKEEQQTKGNGETFTDVVPASRQFKQNGGLESIKEDSFENNKPNVDQNSNTTDSVKQKTASVLAYVRKGSLASSQGSPETSERSARRKGSLASQGSPETFTNERSARRKGSSASTHSNESNPDEDEERDVLEAMGKRREEKLGSYSSSLKLSMSGKKGSRAGSLTPEDVAELVAAFPHQSTVGNIHPFLSSLVNYIHPVPFTGFKEAEKKNLCHHISSFNESTGFSLLKASPVDFVKYDKRQLSRIYPKGARVDSSNYMPQVFWNVGCQMVSLNFQTSDLAFQLNQGKFEYNGGCGYILKPDIMRRSDRVFDPFTEVPIDGLVAASLGVKVISGQYLSDKKISSYVEVDLYGLPTDTIRKKHKTKVVSSNGMNPLYDEDEFKFKRLIVPELTLLRFGVVDDNDKLIAQRVIPLDGLQAGYRHIPMRSEHNMPLPLTTLFVHVSLKTYVPEKFTGIVDELFEPIKYQSAADKRAALMQVYEIDDGLLPQEEDDSVSSFMKKSNSSSALYKTKAPSQLSLANNPMGPPVNPGSAPTSLRLGSELQVIESNLPKQEETKFPPIILGDLRKDKAFMRVFKRYQKEGETLRKKYAKERSVMRRLHTSQLERLVSNYDKVKLSTQKTFERALKKSGEERVSELEQVQEKKLQYLNQTHTDKAKSSLSEQNEEWTNMINREVEEEIGFYEKQAEMQLETLKKLMDTLHEGQLKELSSKHSRENLEIKKKQTKQSIEATRNLAAEKSKSPKEERDRFQKELDRQNLNRFVEERQRLSERQEEEVEEHRARHIEEKKNLETEYRKISLETMAEHMEEIKTNGETLRRAIHTAFQTVLPSH